MGDQEQRKAAASTGSNSQSEQQRKAAEDEAARKKAEEAAKKAEKDAEAAAAAATSDSTDDEETETEKRYSREELFAGGHGLTGYSRITLAGALQGEKRETFTLEQAKEKAAEFLGRPVKTGAEGEEES